MIRRVACRRVRCEVGVAPHRESATSGINIRRTRFQFPDATYLLVQAFERAREDLHPLQSELGGFRKA
ncbi:hypothetical protein IVB40_16075 [Bradyrhizobium sp. 40]|uniref:hypothetical protein n=1 Tax=unclassified Bradyrhizobium TaxID=2631580 RepID=UPI001FF9123E|nr:MULTISPECIES: hypothetical protein [unclassified Bradyrhizobium]MCK1365838.1 hypothetical protein [Bradyrhizobium sp. 62]UPJ45425.1 hypothetical protein IVB40_16075 [Bradyrhizobium sp. 40]